jgi:hypothetical protein
MAGIMRRFDAVRAFRYHGVLPGSLPGAIFGHRLETFGWVYPVVAIISMRSAIAVIYGQTVHEGDATDRVM